MLQLSESAQKWARRLGYVVLTLVTFVFALHHSFAYERFEDQVIVGLEEHFDVKSLQIRPGFFPGDVVVSDVSLKTRPVNGQGKPTELIIDEIVVDPALLSLISGTIDLEVDVRMGDGEASARYVDNGKQVRIDARTTELPLVAIPGVRTVTGGAAMEGGLTAKIKLRMPLNKQKKAMWTQVDGLFEIACVECALPKGTKLRPMSPGQSNVFSQKGFTLPAKVRLGDFGGRVEIVEGKGKFVDFGGKSPDGELHIEGDIEFLQPVGRSQVTAYLRLKFSEAIKRRETRMLDLETLALGAAKRPDGYFGVSMRGPLTSMKFRPSRRSPVASSRKVPKRRSTPRPRVKPPAAKPPPPNPTSPISPSVTPTLPKASGSSTSILKRGGLDPETMARKLRSGGTPPRRDDVGVAGTVAPKRRATYEDEDDDEDEDEEEDDEDDDERDDDERDDDDVD